MATAGQQCPGDASHLVRQRNGHHLVGRAMSAYIPLASANFHLRGVRFNLAHSNREGASICKAKTEAATGRIGYHPRMRSKCLECLALTWGQGSIKLGLTFIIHPKNVDSFQPLMRKLMRVRSLSESDRSVPSGGHSLANRT